MDGGKKLSCLTFAPLDDIKSGEVERGSKLR